MKKLFLLLLVFLACMIGFSQTKTYKMPVKKSVIKMQLASKAFEQPHVNLQQYDSILVDDTIKFKKLLKEYGLYDDFVKGNLDNIDKIKFNRCLQLSKFQDGKGVLDWKKSTYLKYPKNNTSQSPISFEEMKTEKSVLKSISVPPPVVTSIQQEVVSPPAPVINSPNKATLTYVIGDTMMVGKTYDIDLTLSKDMSQKQLINIIDGFKNKSLIDTLIPITNKMRARLLDPSGKKFTIKPITDSIQNTTLSNLIRWQWQIIPLVEGNNSLTISVDIYIDNIPQSINIYDGKTYVYAIHTWYGDLWNWIKTNWTYITYIVSGICAIFAWLYKEKIISIFKKKSS